MSETISVAPHVAAFIERLRGMGDTETICNPRGLQGMYSVADLRKGLELHALTINYHGLCIRYYKHSYQNCPCPVHGWWRWMDDRDRRSPQVFRERLAKLMVQIGNIRKGGKKADPWFADLKGETK